MLTSFPLKTGTLYLQDKRMKKKNDCSALHSSLFLPFPFPSTELTIRSYLQYFRSNFINETIPPKMHILEDHVVPFIKKWHVGLGFLGEQGVESVHARLNSIKYNVRGLSDDLAILKSVMVTHWVQTRPGAQAIR